MTEYGILYDMMLIRYQRNVSVDDPLFDHLRRVKETIRKTMSSLFPDKALLDQDYLDGCAREWLQGSSSQPDRLRLALIESWITTSRRVQPSQTTMDDETRSRLCRFLSQKYALFQSLGVSIIESHRLPNILQPQSGMTVERIMFMATHGFLQHACFAIDKDTDDRLQADFAAFERVTPRFVLPSGLEMWDGTTMTTRQAIQCLRESSRDAFFLPVHNHVDFEDPDRVYSPFTRAIWSSLRQAQGIQSGVYDLTLSNLSCRPRSGLTLDQVSAWVHQRELTTSRQFPSSEEQSESAMVAIVDDLVQAILNRGQDPQQRESLFVFLATFHHEANMLVKELPTPTYSWNALGQSVRHCMDMNSSSSRRLDWTVIVRRVYQSLEKKEDRMFVWAARHGYRWWIIADVKPDETVISGPMEDGKTPVPSMIKTRRFDQEDIQARREQTLLQRTMLQRMTHPQQESYSHANETVLKEFLSAVGIRLEPSIVSSDDMMVYYELVLPSQNKDDGKEKEEEPAPKKKTASAATQKVNLTTHEILKKHEIDITTSQNNDDFYDDVFKWTSEKAGMKRALQFLSTFFLPDDSAQASEYKSNKTGQRVIHSQSHPYVFNKNQDFTIADMSASGQFETLFFYRQEQLVRINGRTDAALQLHVDGASIPGLKSTHVLHNTNLVFEFKTDFDRFSLAQFLFQLVGLACTSKYGLSSVAVMTDLGVNWWVAWFKRSGDQPRYKTAPLIMDGPIQTDPPSIKVVTMKNALTAYHYMASLVDESLDYLANGQGTSRRWSLPVDVESKHHYDALRRLQKKTERPGWVDLDDIIQVSFPELTLQFVLKSKKDATSQFKEGLAFVRAVLVRIYILGQVLAVLLDRSLSDIFPRPMSEPTPENTQTMLLPILDYLVRKSDITAHERHELNNVVRKLLERSSPFLFMSFQRMTDSLKKSHSQPLATDLVVWMTLDYSIRSVVIELIYRHETALASSSSPSRQMRLHEQLLSDLPQTTTSPVDLLSQPLLLPITIDFFHREIITYPSYQSFDGVDSSGWTRLQQDAKINYLDNETMMRFLSYLLTGFIQLLIAEKERLRSTAHGNDYGDLDIKPLSPLKRDMICLVYRLFYDARWLRPADMFLVMSLCLNPRLSLSLPWTVDKTNILTYFQSLSDNDVSSRQHKQSILNNQHAEVLKSLMTE